MADESQRTNWSKIDALTRPDQTEQMMGQPVIPPAPSAETMQGIITQLKANKIQRRAALEAMQLATQARLEVFGHQLQEAIKTKKAEATMLSHQVLADLDAQYQSFLNEIGVRNEAARNDTLKKLGDQTARDLKEVQEKNWPDFMITKTLELIMQRYASFLDKLRGDLTDKS